MALPDESSEDVARVEDLLVAVAERAPEALVARALEALAAGGNRLRPILLVLGARAGEPGRKDLLTASVAVEVLQTATFVYDGVVD